MLGSTLRYPGPAELSATATATVWADGRAPVGNAMGDWAKLGAGENKMDGSLVAEVQIS